MGIKERIIRKFVRKSTPQEQQEYDTKRDEFRYDEKLRRKEQKASQKRSLRELTRSKELRIQRKEINKLKREEYESSKRYKAKQWVKRQAKAGIRKGIRSLKPKKRVYRKYQRKRRENWENY